MITRKQLIAAFDFNRSHQKIAGRPEDRFSLSKISLGEYVIINTLDCVYRVSGEYVCHKSQAADLLSFALSHCNLSERKAAKIEAEMLSIVTGIVVAKKRSAL